MLCGVYKGYGIRIRTRWGAERPRDIEPPGPLTTVGGDRESASCDAADCVKAPARAARGRLPGIQDGRTKPSLPAGSWTARGAGCLAGRVSPVLVRLRGCSRTPPGPHTSFKTGRGHTGEKEGKREIAAAQTAEIKK